MYPVKQIQNYNPSEKFNCEKELKNGKYNFKVQVIHLNHYAITGNRNDVQNDTLKLLL